MCRIITSHTRTVCSMSTDSGAEFKKKLYNANYELTLWIQIYQSFGQNNGIKGQ